VFFDSADPLLPQVADGMRNVYEWEAAGDGTCPSGEPGGCLYLISTGQSANDSFFLDDGASGNDVFFATSDGLVPQDTDGIYDVYDARVGGEFPSGGPAPCSGDACQGAATGAPSPPLAGSVSFTGPGNESSSESAAAPASARASVIRGVVRGTRFVLSIRVSSAGRITIAGADVKTVTKSLAKAGAYKVTVFLTRSGIGAVKRRKRLKLTLRVGYVPAVGSASRAVITFSVRR
jgi:hypothetical protein